MGLNDASKGKQLFDANSRTIQKAGYQFYSHKIFQIYVCGMPFSSKGFNDAAHTKSAQLEDALLHVSEFGEYQFYVIQVHVLKNA